MFIDTHTKESMCQSICSILRISPIELYNTLWKIYSISDINSYNINDRLEEFINKQIESQTELPQEIILFHLTRRLNSSDDDTLGLNLADLLTLNNAMSDFLKNHYLVFTKKDQRIDTYYKGQIVDWDRCEHGNYKYMKYRLGFVNGYRDFCINGFAFKDLLYKNDYAKQLFEMPEFMRILLECLSCNNIGNDFMNNSHYYCYEYKLPIDKVIFDGHEEYTKHQKQIHLICCVLERIMYYQTTEQFYLNDNENPILRLEDIDTISKEMFLNREQITYDMLQ